MFPCDHARSTLVVSSCHLPSLSHKLFLFPLFSCFLCQWFISLFVSYREQHPWGNLYSLWHGRSEEWSYLCTKTCTTIFGRTSLWHLRLINEILIQRMKLVSSVDKWDFKIGNCQPLGKIQRSIVTEGHFNLCFSNSNSTSRMLYPLVNWGNFNVAKGSAVQSVK